jgi:hypothetical protein
MVPASFLFRDIYNDRWGDPDNPHAVDVPPAGARPNRKTLGRLADLFSRHRRNRVDAWSFTLPSCTSEAHCNLHHGVR